MAVSSSRGSRGGRAPRPETPGREIAGTARVGKRTKLLVRRLRAGDAAIIDHQDLDRVSAEELVASGVRAVVNASRSSSGSYPNMGPLLLVQAGGPAAPRAGGRPPAGRPRPHAARPDQGRRPGRRARRGAPPPRGGARPRRG